MATRTLPPVRLAQNLRLVGHTEFGGAANVGEGLAMKLTADGQRLLYVAHENPPMALTILDVTSPADPTIVWQKQVEHADVRANSLALRGDLLLVARQVNRPGLEPAGFETYDVSDPRSPRRVGWFDTSGPHSQGVHFVSLMHGRYAHLSTGARDFEPKDPRDHQFYMIVDVQDPARPREVGRWWLPGQRKGDREVLERHAAPSRDFAFRPHHILSYAERADRAYVGYIDGGVVILDISDPTQPRLVGRLDYHPPLPGFTHTVLPLFERGLFLVADEATGDEGLDWPKLYWVVDARVERNPVILSTFPVPADFETLHRIGGRIGAHNVHENEPEPGSARLVNTAVATWFSAGLRIYDLTDPFRPNEIAAFLPETPPGQRGCRISDVFVDDRGIIYAGDRAKGGLYILEYTGARPLG